MSNAKWHGEWSPVTRLSDCPASHAQDVWTSLPPRHQISPAITSRHQPRPSSTTISQVTDPSTSSPPNDYRPSTTITLLRPSPFNDNHPSTTIIRSSKAVLAVCPSCAVAPLLAARRRVCRLAAPGWPPPRRDGRSHVNLGNGIVFHRRGRAAEHRTRRLRRLLSPVGTRLGPAAADERAIRPA